MSETHNRFERQVEDNEKTGQESVLAAYLVIDQAGKIVSQSTSAAELLTGEQRLSLEGNSLFGYFHCLPPELAVYTCPSRYLELKVEVSISNRCLLMGIFPAENSGQGGSTNLVFLRDVTLRLEENELAETYKHYGALFEVSSDAIFFETIDGDIFDCNTACERIFGYSKAELLNMNARGLVPGDFISTIEGLIPELEHARSSGQPICLEGIGKRKDGSIFPNEVAINFVKIAGEECFAVTIKDITFRREIESTKHRYENRVLQLQKLDNLGQMASGLANDFNNLMTGIMGYSDLLMRDLPPEGGAREKAKRIIEAARKASEIIQQLMSYTGKLPTLYQKTSMGALLKEMQPELQALVSNNVVLKISSDADLPDINVDPPMIKQALLNIVKNSMEAIDGDRAGKILISAFPGLCSYYGNEPGYFGPPIKAGSYMVLKITDNGCGIEPEHLNRIFDPFFTTRFAGRGLGLSAVLGMLRSHRGAVCVTSMPGQGTEFAIFLPFASAGAACDTTVTGKQPEEKFHAGVVLVVDDDFNVREIIADNLRSLGYETFLAENGQEGLAMFKTLHQRLTVVITDLAMPGLNGTDIIKEMRWLNPEIPVLVCTGFLLEDKRAELENLGVVAILEKPFSLRELEKVLMRIQLKSRNRKAVP